MKFTLSWLKEHLDTEASLAEIIDTLTASGLEVEGVEDSSAGLSAFSVAEILEATPHPDADKLRVCRVQSDTGELQIVCGAPNARAGIKVALANVGARIPNGDFVIKKSKIRGVESCGMLCSANELNLGQDHDGIMELPGDAPIGVPIAEVLGLDDPLIEIAITPNRGDCLGVYGIARDLAAAGIGTLKPLPSLENLPFPEKNAVSITLETDSCRRFIGVRITGVRNGPAPEWLQKKLMAIGLRPISALVDITNYFTHTYARPLHVYDVQKLQGGIIVREARQGESFAALNDKTYTLSGGECAICDEGGVLGLGGIVGGESTGVSESTCDVLLECAWFEPEAIARAGRAHDILTDARYRFERTVDPGFMMTGAQLAAQMIVELCGGTVEGVTVAGELSAQREAIAVSDDAINRLSGMPIASQQQQDILTRLGFSCEPKGQLNYIATPPSWRPDVTGTADIAEEILRIYGYDKLPAISLPKPEAPCPPALTEIQLRDSRLRRLLATRGLHECHHWAFMSDSVAAHFGEVKPELILINPISQELNYMRPTLLAHLIDSARRNMARGADGATLFELGSVYHGTSECDQHGVAAVLRAGQQIARDWRMPGLKASWSKVKADALAVLTQCGIDTEKLTIIPEAPHYYHPGRSGAIKLGPKNTLAYFGELHPLTLQYMDASAPMAACEVLLEALPKPKRKRPQALQLSEYPAVERDFAFVLPEAIEAQQLISALRSAERTLLQSVHLFDVYRGKGLDEGEKSLAISVRLQAADRTLTEAEIEQCAKKLVGAAESLGAKLRG